MRRQIRIQNKHHEVSLTSLAGEQWMCVGNSAGQKVKLEQGTAGQYTVDMGGHSEKIDMVVKGETAFIKAFGRSFTLSIVDPVEQAVQSSGGRSNSSKAPMPGVVVDIQVKTGDQVTKGQSLMTIESMKILTVIKSPRNGQVDQIHLDTGQTFDKNALLVSLTKIEES